VRGKEKTEILKNLLGAKDNILSGKQFDSEGNVAFGIHEYIDIPGSNYEPEIGLMGLQVCVTLHRPGFRIKKRRIHTTRLPKQHRISKEESVGYFKEQFNIKLAEEAAEE